MKIGMELEYWTVDKEGRLASSKELAQRLDSGEQEFVEPLLEIKTSPHEEIADMRNEVRHIMTDALSEAEELGLKIVPLGTPLNSGDIEMVESRRAGIQNRIIGENLKAAKRVAGTHIHFEKENVKHQLNALTAMDPALSLMNSSPYYRGAKLAASSRNQVYRYRCYRNFPKHGQLWPYVDSVKEWEKRVEKRFEEFREAGKEKGIKEDEIREHFKAYDALWTPVRLRKQFPTVEWRAPDTGNIEDALRMAEESKKIVEKASEDKLETEIPDFDKVQQLSQRAIRKGLKDSKVRNYLERLGFSPEKYTPYHPDSPGDLTKKESEKLRLKKAEKLEEKLSSSLKPV
jgi:gamma-glutamyl:cysteine ligase YbdK (ATP-grasp superfamily)